MAEGYYKLATQIGGRGAFAAVRLAVEESSPPTSTTVAESELIAKHYIPAAKTGIEYAHEQLILEGQHPPSVNVTILEIQYTTADTLIMFVVYAACLAYCDALGITLKRPILFDGENHQTLFPHGCPKDEYD
jgi:hypothetical protein